MTWFTQADTTVRYGLVIDIGSGSVLVSIVESDRSQSIPTILWAKREYAPLHSNSDDTQAAKAIMTSLMNALLEFETTARTVLHAYNARAHITHLQVSISAPWSYTVTKNVTYIKETPFTITDNLINTLFDAATQKIQEELHENEQASALSLHITQRTPLSITANGYKFTRAENQTATELQITYASTVVQDHLAKTLQTVQKKIAPRAQLHTSSFMMSYYRLLQKEYPHWEELAAIDITYEATEIGIIRGGALRYCTHAAMGPLTIARTIAGTTKQPVSDVFSRMQNITPEGFIDLFPNKYQPVITEALDSYRSAFRTILQETGDALSIPKTIAIHVEKSLEPFFLPLILQTARATTKVAHVAYPITSQLVTSIEDSSKNKKTEAIITDTAMLASAYFFHTGYSASGRSTLLEDILE